MTYLEINSRKGIQFVKRTKNSIDTFGKVFLKSALTAQIILYKKLSGLLKINIFYTLKRYYTIKIFI